MFREASESEIQDRLDLTVMAAYRNDPSSVQKTRKNFLQTWHKDEKIARLALSRMDGLGDVSEEENQRAIRNIVDYWFEPLVLPTMNLWQLRQYFLNIEEWLDIQIDEGVPEAGKAPLVIQTMHHYCIFSIFYTMGVHLLGEFGYEKVILPHINTSFDPRLEVLRAMTTHVLGKEFVTIKMEKDWYKTLMQEADDRTIVIYMADMSPQLFEKFHRPGKTSSHLQLFTDPNITFDIEGLSVGPLLARRLKANHMIQDFPAVDTTRIRPWKKETKLACPLSEWIFWPAIQSLYNEFSVSSPS